MIAPLKPALAALALGALITASPAVAQDGVVGQDPLQDLSAELGGIASRVQHSVTTTMAEMGNLAALSSDEQRARVLRSLKAEEEDIRAMIASVNSTSPFMAALNDARANVVVMLRREERQAMSPERDARIADLTDALASIDDQMRQMRALEAMLMGLLDELRVGDTLPDISQVLSAQAAFLSGVAANTFFAAEGCSAVAAPLRSSISAADDGRHPQAPSSGDVQSCSISGDLGDPTASPDLNDMRNQE